MRFLALCMLILAAAPVLGQTLIFELPPSDPGALGVVGVFADSATIEDVRMIDVANALPIEGEVDAIRFVADDRSHAVEVDVSGNGTVEIAYAYRDGTWGLSEQRIITERNLPETQRPRRSILGALVIAAAVGALTFVLVSRT